MMPRIGRSALAVAIGFLPLTMGCLGPANTLVRHPAEVSVIPFSVEYEYSYDPLVGPDPWIEIMVGRRIGYVDDNGEVHEFKRARALKGQSTGQLVLGIESAPAKPDHYRAVGVGVYTDYVVEGSQVDAERPYAPVRLDWAVLLKSDPVSAEEVKSGGKDVDLTISVYGRGPEKRFVGTLALPKVRGSAPPEIEWPEETTFTLYHKGTGLRVRVASVTFYRPVLPAGSD